MDAMPLTGNSQKMRASDDEMRWDGMVCHGMRWTEDVECGWGWDPAAGASAASAFADDDDDDVASETAYRKKLPLIDVAVEFYGRRQMAPQMENMKPN